MVSSDDESIPDIRGVAKTLKMPYPTPKSTGAMKTPKLADSMPKLADPKRGGIHIVYGLYLGGSPLDDMYKPKKESRFTCRFASQRRNPKNISTIESALVNARDSITNLKFDGRLEATVGSASEIGKERFIALLQRKVEEHGQDTFYHVTNSLSKVVNLFDHVHNFTLDAVITEFERRSSSSNTAFEAFDTYELDEITMSRLVVESRSSFDMVTGRISRTYQGLACL